jgi:NADPH:quinone reductase-like Zn-dependent oxidoreductase
VREITRGDGVAAAIDAVGGATGAQVAACLRPRGVMVTMGMLGGTELGPLDTRAMIFNETTLRGFWVTTWFGRRPPEVIGKALTEVMTLLATGELQPATEAEYDLGDFRSAIEHTRRPGRHGKILLVG